jgi:hypothetical protein
LDTESTGELWAAFDWPPRPRSLLKWFFGFPGYLLPWNLLYAVAAV